MAKAPADQFYYGDWLRDTAPLSLAARGAWITSLAAMWFAQDRGVLTMRLEAFARLFGCGREEASLLLDEIAELGVGDRVTLEDGRVQLICRRMVRDEAERDSAAGRKRKQREREGTFSKPADISAAVPSAQNGSHANVTPMSRECHIPSSSSSSASTSSSLIDSYVRASVAEHADKDPKLVEIAVLETLIRRKGSGGEHRPIRSAKYFDAEIDRYCQPDQGGALSPETREVVLRRRRQQVRGEADG